MAKGTFFKKFQSENREIVQLQQNTESALSQLANSTSQNGVLLENIELETGDNVINHKLGRKIKGYRIERRSASLSYYDKISTDTNLEQQFTLNSSATCTVSVWVY